MHTTINGAVDSARTSLADGISIDKIAGQTIESETLKLIYHTLMNLGLALFGIGIVLALATDGATRDKFYDYLGDTVSVVQIVVLVVLAVLVFSLNKAYKSDKKYQPKTKRAINCFNDIIKGVIFILIIAFISQFIWQNEQKTKLVVAYWIFIISMIMFNLLHIIKWYYFCYGNGRDNLRPWTPVQEEFDPQERQVLKKIAKDKTQQLSKVDRNVPLISPEQIESDSDGNEAVNTARPLQNNS